MDLELASGRVVRAATSDDILAHLDGEEFAILSTGPESYIQCGEQKEPPYEYELEYRDGSQDAHYRAADGPITLDRVISAFIWHLQGDPAWRLRFRWERIESP
jgi:GGDEF domain-containing protein